MNGHTACVLTRVVYDTGNGARYHGVHHLNDVRRMPSQAGILAGYDCLDLLIPLRSSSVHTCLQASRYHSAADVLL